MSLKKPCINVPTATYSGKEQSPLRFGISAEGYDRYTTMEGFDKLVWMVDIKNNKKVWIRKITTEKVTHEEPIITSKDNLTEINNSQDTKDFNSNKKITDYNIYLSYRLKQLKDENKDLGVQNKELFNKAMSEWKVIKNSPIELKDFINKAKQDPSFLTITSSKKKKKGSNDNLVSEVEETPPPIMKSIVVEKEDVKPEQKRRGRKPKKTIETESVEEEPETMKKDAVEEEPVKPEPKKKTRKVKK